MTFDECQQELEVIRRRQGTRLPVIRVNTGGSSYKGRLSRSDSDPDNRPPPSIPFGVLVLEEPGLVRGPKMILQIDAIDQGGISDPTSN